MGLVEGISDRVIALDYGEKLAEGSFDQVATDPKVIEAYLGRTHESIQESGVRNQNAGHSVS
jgi:branched-chain amino acid transport system ATP-binding protein